MGVISIIVTVIVAIIAVLIVCRLMRDYSRSVEERVVRLRGDVLSIAKDVLELKVVMPFLSLDEEKVAKTLFKFARANNLEKLKHCMESGVLPDINMQDDNGETFGHIAVQERNKPMFDWFVRNGGKTNIRGGKGNRTVNEILKEDTEVQMWRSIE